MIFIFGSIRFLSNKNNQIKLKKNRNRFKPIGFGLVWFFRIKTGSNRFGLVFSGLAWFFQFGSVFFVWVWFGLVFLVSSL